MKQTLKDIRGCDDTLAMLEMEISRLTEEEARRRGCPCFFGCTPRRCGEKSAPAHRAFDRAFDR